MYTKSNYTCIVVRNLLHHPERPSIFARFEMAIWYKHVYFIYVGRKKLFEVVGYLSA